MTKCTQCNKKSSRTRTLTDGVCNECNNDTAIEVDYDDAPCDPEDKLGDTPAKDFVEWMCRILVKCVKEPLSHQLAECSKELKQTKDDVKNLKTSLTNANKEIDTLKVEIKAIKDERDKEKKTVRDNCRYLINHDRSARQRNLLLFGVPDEESITLNNETVTSNREVAQLIFEKIGVHDVNIIESFRLGKKKDNDENAERPHSRPIKVCLESSDMARSVLSESSKLKDVFDGSGINIYMKPDKTKAERDEYTRLGKKKAELLTRHPPAEENGEPRVVLKSGILLVDGVQVDCYKTPQSLF